MSKIVIIDHSHYTKSGSIANRTKEELKQKGFSHLWNESDFAYHFNQAKHQAKKCRAGFNPSWAALEIAQAIINENPQAQSDFSTYIF